MKPSDDRSPEFDAFAPTYAELLDDPIRNRFAKDPLHFHRRKRALMQSLLKRAGVVPSALRWLDVGCGQGELLALAGGSFASAEGCDPAVQMLPADAAFRTRVQPSPVELPFADGSVDFVTAVCVYHHVHGSDAKGASRTLLTNEIKRVLTPGGLCCVIEHNPWNPVTQTIVRRCAVDVDAQLLAAGETRGLLKASGFQCLSTDYFLFLPESLHSKLGSLEGLLAWLPFGGQYAVLARA